ncbi:Spo12 family protein [Schizosaccharomyces octosporus yFS286]|uniref:Spo12 family protein n=1 Tax=Schizosaccharomyces octosporus (strain yFS286) TaxID=483514 RepID=S9RBM9_SCHOY|nr:Spo12 family protein [Schizosaccharomyces octosporus yFS286]EPX71529.1 Spo12 family protein [Schizosaccharomyces octosporus yFS286]
MAYAERMQKKGSPEISVQPLHQGNKSLHKQLLEPRFLREKNKATVSSPTDSLMSPCTAKLQAHKQKYHTRNMPGLRSLMQTLLEARDNE